MALRVLIVDDSDAFRAQAQLMLAAWGYDVVGEAPKGGAGIRAAQELMPDVVLLDVQLPDVSGFDVAREIHADGGPAAIILISSREASDYGARIGRSEAVGFISKAELSAATLETVLNGTEPLPTGTER